MPAVLIIIWLVAAAVGGPTFGKLSSVSTNDQAAFLPANAEATQVSEWQSEFRESDSIPAIVVLESEDPISPQELPQYAELADDISGVDGVQSDIVAGPIPSEDGVAVQYIVPIADSEQLQETVAALTEVVAANAPDGTTSYVTGPAGLTADLANAFGGIDGILLGVALAAVFIILLVVYRAVLLPFLVLATSVFALCASILVIYLLAREGVISLSGQSQGILSILVIGAATDYSLLLVARYRESLLQYQSRWTAMVKALRGSSAPIVASGATVIIALLCLLFSQLKSNQSLGPIAATGIVFSLLAALTFLPAVLLATGRLAFWPFRPRAGTAPAAESASGTAAGLEGARGLWKRVGGLVARRPRVTWISSLVLLIAAAAGVTQLQAAGVPQSDFILAESDAVKGQQVQAEHFDAGSGSPVIIIAGADDRQEVLAEVKQTPGVTQASFFTGSSPQNAPSGPPSGQPSGQPSSASPNAPSGPPSGAEAQSAPVVRDGRVMINAITDKPAQSEAAEDVIRELRQIAPEANPEVLVGGTTAVALDTNVAAQSDLRTIIPLVLIVILAILMVLLRSVLAPVLLIASVVLSYLSALGVSALVFNHVFDFPGADASVPLFGFVFLVALGVDYNIFLMTRVREESVELGTRPGILKGLVKTGGVITSAGIVLAATFAALGVIPILFLVQIAFIVSFGVLLDTVVVRSLLVPALSYDIGPRIWWPGRLSKEPARLPLEPDRSLGKAASQRASR
ncbi:MMPL family transporter [Arthrobacter castelli]|uniref:MMPL family transporter n=1 Tax=Arthrobacter castelli TaxID=271431 RepID=UPI0003FFC22D|nr:MMPL family transporter [Arthrobacter castelli]